jgi:hypothetical protein
MDWEREYYKFRKIHSELNLEEMPTGEYKFLNNELFLPREYKENLIKLSRALYAMEKVASRRIYP